MECTSIEFIEMPDIARSEALSAKRGSRLAVEPLSPHSRSRGIDEVEAEWRWEASKSGRPFALEHGLGVTPEPVPRLTVRPQHNHKGLESLSFHNLMACFCRNCFQSKDFMLQH